LIEKEMKNEVRKKRNQEVTSGLISKVKKGGEP
jgi:hypothetical protein